MIYISKFLPIPYCISIFILFFTGIVSGATPIAYIESPKNGAFVQSPVEIIFGLDEIDRQIGDLKLLLNEVCNKVCL